MEHFAGIVTQYVDLVAAITMKDQLDDAAQKARSRLVKRMIKVCRNGYWLWPQRIHSFHHLALLHSSSHLLHFTAL